MSMTAMVFGIFNIADIHNLEPVKVISQIHFGEIMDGTSGFAFEGIDLSLCAPSEALLFIRKKL